MSILYNHIPWHCILLGILKELNVFHGFRYLLDSKRGKVLLHCCDHFFSWLHFCDHKLLLVIIKHKSFLMAMSLRSLYMTAWKVSRKGEFALAVQGKKDLLVLVQTQISVSSHQWYTHHLDLREYVPLCDACKGSGHLFSKTCTQGRSDSRLETQPLYTWFCITAYLPFLEIWIAFFMKQIMAFSEV